MVVMVVVVGGWLARHRTIEKMSAPHRLDIFKHGHRAVCNGVLISSFLDILGSWSWFWRCSGLGCRAVVIVGDEMSLQFGSREVQDPSLTEGRSKAHP